MDTIYNLFPKDLALIVEEYSKDRTNYDKVMRQLVDNTSPVCINNLKVWMLKMRYFSAKRRNSCSKWCQNTFLNISYHYEHIWKKTIFYDFSWFFHLRAYQYISLEITKYHLIYTLHHLLSSITSLFIILNIFEKNQIFINFHINWLKDMTIYILGTQEMKVWSYVPLLIQKVGGAPVCLSIVFRDDEGSPLGVRRQRIVLE